MVPLNSCRPMVPNKMKMKPRKMVTLPSSGSELRRAPTSYLMLGTALMLFRGLITLKTRSGLILIDPRLGLAAFCALNSMMPEIAITKSMTFQTSYR